MPGNQVCEVRNVRHKDEYRPILVLPALEAIDPPCSDIVIRPDKSPTDGGPGCLLVGVILRNIGRGPALKSRKSSRFQGLQDYGAIGLATALHAQIG